MRWLLLLSAFLVAQTGRTQSLGDSTRSIRYLGMGGVAVPFVRGAESLFINPAGLGSSPLLDIKLIDVGVGTSKYMVENIQDFKDINPDEPATLEKFYGKKLWVQTNGKVAVSLPNFAIGYLNDAEVSAELHNPSFPKFETYFRNDDAVYIGGSFPIYKGTYLGMNLRRVNRWGGQIQELGVGDITNVSGLQEIGDRFANRGQGYGMDLALMMEVPMPILKPTLALVWQDVGSTAFKKTAGEDAPPRIEQNLTFGAGLGLDLPGLDVLFGMEARHLMQSDIEIGKKLHLGAEVSLPLIDVRAGYNQGYLSYGVGINFLIFHLDAVSYTEETGFYPGQAGDARYMVSLGFDLSFDADFKFTDNSGKRRKLKQRR
ncbi:MAG: hypothetical protein HUU57_00815 [Bdellovibrio sp.]|nr:hypothetical protein [Bdellovibrio sp.]